MDQSIWKVLVDYLWVPTLTLVGALVAIIRQSDLHRIQSLEKYLKLLATKEEVHVIEKLANQAVQKERFQEYIDGIEAARIENKAGLSAVVSEIKSAQQRTDDKLSTLTERVIAFGLARDERREPRG